MTVLEHAEVEAREAVDELVESYRHDDEAGTINALDQLREYVADRIALLRAEADVRLAKSRVEQWKSP